MNNIRKMLREKLIGAINLYQLVHKVAPTDEQIQKWKDYLGITWNVDLTKSHNEYDYLVV